MHLLRKTPAELAAMQGAALYPEDAICDWEAAFCRWLAAHPYMKLKRQCEVATRLAGTDIDSRYLRQLKYRPGWRALWTPLRAESDDYRAMAEERVKKQMPRAARILEKSLRAVEEELLTGDKMGAVRAGTPLISEMLARIAPKKGEGQGATTVTINLTAAQSAGLASAELSVTAEEIPFEVIPEEGS